MLIALADGSTLTIDPGECWVDEAHSGEHATLTWQGRGGLESGPITSEELGAQPVTQGDRVHVLVAPTPVTPSSQQSALRTATLDLGRCDGTRAVDWQIHADDVFDDQDGKKTRSVSVLTVVRLP